MMKGRSSDEDQASKEAQEYAERLEKLYEQLAREQRQSGAAATGLEEVKLRLFLSLLRAPEERGLARHPDSASHC